MTESERTDRTGEVADTPRWYALDVDRVAAELETGPDGLSEDEARCRLERYGPNEVEAERETPWWSLLLRQIRDPLIYILIVAALATLLLGHEIDSIVIGVVVVLNTLVGFIQEYRAQQAMRALASLSAPRASVLRDGRPHEIPTREVVPGDVVLLASGARVPADVRITHSRDLQIDESLLTGESVPVAKQTGPLEGDVLVAGDQRNMAFGGTVVTRGRGRGIVVRTGARSEIGRIADAVRGLAESHTPLQDKFERFGVQIAIAIILLAIVTAGLGLLRGLPTDEIVLTAIALAVATIPEGLPVVLTVTLAVGVRRMARRNAIIRRLPAVETLGSTTVIASDKTGTLTRNEMTVRAVWTGGRTFDVTGDGYDIEGGFAAADTQGDNAGDAVDAAADPGLRATLVAGVLASEADAAALREEDVSGDPTELALLVAAAKAGLDPDTLRREQPLIDQLPFESERRFMGSLHDGPDGRRLWLKGAPEAVLERCDRMLGPGGAEVGVDADAARRAAAAFAERGLRVLAMAYRDEPADAIDEASIRSGFVLAGLQGMEDPVRHEAVEAVAAARASGIRVLMLTGDHADTALAIGRQLGLGQTAERAVEGRDLETLSDDELDRTLKDVDVFARVAPEHKLRITQRLRAHDEIVAVTGDGVNDAPALRAAHIGVAMGKGGTDVAREAADMVLADDNFATITAAVEEGRIVFSNVRKVTFFLLSTGAGGVLTILASLVLGWPLPFVPVQMLWINLVTNGLQDVALAFERGEPGLLKRPPRPKDEGIITLRVAERLAGVGIVIAAGTLAVFWWALESTGDLDVARSVAMTQMVVFQFFHVYNSRSLDRSLFRIPLLSNRFLFVAFLMALTAQLAVLYATPLQAVFRTVPLTTDQWLVVAVVGAAVIVGGELDKWRNRRAGRPLG
jgi:magnesium-transporting ATPase (P-type)